jgi:hypothetical protein
MGPRSSSVGAPTSVGSGSSPVGAADRGARPCQLYCTGDGRESPSASGGMSRFVFFFDENVTFRGRVRSQHVGLFAG